MRVATWATRNAVAMTSSEVSDSPENCWPTSERRAVEWPVLPGMLAGWALGACAGAVVLPRLPDAAAGAFAGVAVLLAVAVSLGRTAARSRTPTTCLAAGTASGFVGTIAAVGGPLLALLYRSGEASRRRSTLAAVFTAGYLVSFLALSLAGQVSGWHGKVALALLPGLAAGLWLSRLIHRVLDRPWFEPVLLGFAGVMGAATLARALLSP